MRKALITLLVLCVVPVALAQAGGGTVQTVTVTLTSAQILTLYSSPVQVVPAPGAGQILNPISFTLQYKFGTTAYVVAQQDIHFTGPAQNQYANLSAVNFLDAPSSRVATVPATGQASADAATYANQPIMVGLTASDATQGDGTVTITVCYTVVALQ